jgi:single-strand DNA-binding protein
MFSKLIRIGKDAELKHLPSGTQVLEINGVYDIGFGDKKESQWIRLAMFGQRAEKLQQHFTKGKQIVIYADEIKARPYMKGDGAPGCSLEGKLVDFDFAGGQQATQNVAPQQSYQPQQQVQQHQPQQDEGFDDIPFIDPYHRATNIAHCI